jgi:hypothetical protein
MAINKHITAVLDGSAQSFTDRVFLGEQIGIANVAGAGAGESVATVVTFVEPLPLSYTALVQPGQAAAWFISNKTVFGFHCDAGPTSVNRNTLSRRLRCCAGRLSL